MIQLYLNTANHFVGQYMLYDTETHACTSLSLDELYESLSRSLKILKENRFCYFSPKSDGILLIKDINTIELTKNTYPELFI